MAWTAHLEAINTIDGNFNAVYLNGAQRVSKLHRVAPTDAAITSTVRAEIARLDAADAGGLTLKVGDAIDITPPPPPPPPPAPTPAPDPTPEQIARNAFRSDLYLLERRRRLVSAGLMLASDPKIILLIAKLKTEWLPEYEEFL